ncbi:AmpG family muropeptide MFS transporter [Candidatus Sororendozoicomonas aggregata]|uniref:AmpG family muropeptide MFS transporter n=1 Tax=Candidatus Sororendozoicomonas aggregata TaxID=3073239 RepID=UPI002ED43C90
MIEKTTQTTWRNSLAIYMHRRAIILFFLGFSAGLPLMLVFSSLSFWLREADVSRATIGFFSWVGLAYGLKWVWSPLVDKLPLPWLGKRLGRRRSWLLLSQLGVAGALAGMGVTDPANNLGTMALFAVLVAFSSATQDIVIDAYRIESAEQRLQAALAATYMVGYRLAMLLATAGVLSIAAWFSTTGDNSYELYPWQIAYLAMAGFMGIGIVTTLLIAEPEAPEQPVAERKARQWLSEYAFIPTCLQKPAGWFYGAAVSPFVDFVRRYRWHAVVILALISTYRISDIVMGIMANPFYVDLGYTKEEVATVSKVVGVIMTLVGAAFAGGLMIRLGIMRVLFISGLMVVVTNLMFAWLATLGHDLLWFTVVISLDSLAGGMAAAAFIAYLSSLTNISYCATQYALLSSVMMLFPKFVAGFSGVMVDHMGYSAFFVVSALIGLPALVLIVFASRFSSVSQ